MGGAEKAQDERRRDVDLRTPSDVVAHEARREPGVLLRLLEDEGAKQERHVLHAHGERGGLDDVGEPPEKVVLDDGEIPVRGRDDEDIGRLRLRLALAGVLALERAEEPRLHLDRQLADLVEEERAASCLADETGTLGHPGVGVARSVPEENRIGQARGKRRCVVRDEPPRASGEPMDGACRQLFAGARQPMNEHVAAGVRRRREGSPKRPRGRGLTDDAVNVRLAERMQRAEVVNRGRQDRRALHEEEDRALDDLHDGAGPDAPGGALLEGATVDEDLVVREVGDLQAAEDAPDEELASREVDADERAAVQVRARALTDESRARRRVVGGGSVAPEHPPGVRPVAEEGDLADARGLLLAPDEDQGRDEPDRRGCGGGLVGGCGDRGVAGAGHGATR